jgi:DNA polymerase/3'-5' exonuclease PolX
MAPDPIIAPVAAPSLSNTDIADRFELLGDLLELEGAVVYRVLAYRRAAKTLRETPESVARLSEQGKLVDLPNIGATINDKVTELLATGSIAALDKVIARNPPGAVAVMHVPGIGPKTARKIFSELQITTAEEAVQAARDGRIRDVPGMGEKTEKLLIEGLSGAPQKGRPRVSVARLRPLAEQVVDVLSELPGVEACEIAGSLRRYAETAKDIDIVCASATPREVIEVFAGQEWVNEIEAGRRQGHLHRPRRDARRAADRRSRVLRQPARAPDRLQGAQRRAARGGRPAQALDQRVRHHRHQERRGDAERRRGGRVRQAWPALDPTRAP